jgi:N-formylglutamate deformylase
VQRWQRLLGDRKRAQMGSDQPDDLWGISRGDSPIVATAIHDGHDVREEVAEIMALPEPDRLREEDPYTGVWAEVALTRLVPRRSRFEVDLNRPRDRAVYLGPEDAWGLQVWKNELPGALVERSLVEYDAFHAQAHEILSELVSRFGVVVVLDLHTYNHRRSGPVAEPADPESNPEVNVGTGTVDKERFAGIVDRFVEDLGQYDFRGRHLDVRENVKFRGGHFSRWVHETFPGTACTLAVEFKKFFMDEWSGEIDRDLHGEISRALAATVPGLHTAAEAVCRNR